MAPDEELERIKFSTRYSIYSLSLQTINMARRFEIEDTITPRHSRLNAMGTQLIIRLLPPFNDRDSFSHFLASVNDLYEHALQNLSDSEMVGITIHNRVNQNNKPIGLSCRRKHQLAGDVIWRVFEVSQSNSRFNSLNNLTMTCIPLGCLLVSASVQ